LKLTPCPKDFKVWYDRWETHSWVWREKANSRCRSDPETDVTEGQGYDSRRDARLAIEEELRERECRGRVAAN
jgi:hypothetical protein